MAFKEYFILRIASALKIGPNLNRSLGFDMFLYDNCIEFAIEECIHLSNIQITSNLIEKLKNNLLDLHKLQIVHLDIKPENLMYSPAYRSIVFIDYGLSEIT